LIVYEFPFNESVRAWLRLEPLLLRLDELRQRDSAIDHHHALATLFEVLDVGARSELKSELLQELERQRRQLAALRGNPAVADELLVQTLQEVESTAVQLNQTQGKLGLALAGHEWLAAVRSRIAIPGGTCSFDLPAYHAWLQGPAARRQHDLQGWRDTVQPWSRAVTAVLGLLRGGGSTQAVSAQAGRFQHSLNSLRPPQLARLTLPQAGPWVPEISGNRLLLVVRMLCMDAQGHLASTQESIPFQLTLCS
jgi:cell division protein ZapD